MAEIGLSASTLAAEGIRALEAGDRARAIETLGAIPEASWRALAARFPGFPTQLLEAGTPLHELPPAAAE